MIVTTVNCLKNTIIGATKMLYRVNYLTPHPVMLPDCVSPHYPFTRS